MRLKLGFQAAWIQIAAGLSSFLIRGGERRKQNGKREKTNRQCKEKMKMEREKGKRNNLSLFLCRKHWLNLAFNETETCTECCRYRLARGRRSLVDRFDASPNVGQHRIVSHRRLCIAKAPIRLSPFSEACFPIFRPENEPPLVSATHVP